MCSFSAKEDRFPKKKKRKKKKQERRKSQRKVKKKKKKANAFKTYLKKKKLWSYPLKILF